jgi:hypothetical protein
MTTTERNQANAQHSTGPRTEEGKQRSAQNARTHGLNSTKLFIPEDRLEEFKSLFNALHSEIEPIGELQSQFFEQLVHAAWNRDIARTLLAVALAHMDDKKIANANRYIAQYDRAFSKALKELKELQTDLALRAIPENLPIAALPISCEIKKIGNEATRLSQPTERTQRPASRLAILTHIGHAFAATAQPSAQEETPVAA